jgi:hypothetical protein
MNYSPEQTAVREAVLRGESVSANACAGAGKSSTIRPLCNELIRQGKRVTSIPFQNTLYAEELAAMPGADVLNAHKRGIRMLNGFERPQVETNKCLKLAEQIDGPKANEIADLASKLKCENWGVDEDVSADWVADKYGIDAKFITPATQVVIESDAKTNQIDFDDMLRFPVLLNKLSPVDFIVIDEAQDYTPLMRRFLQLFIGPNTQGLIAGDPERQALQQFCGGNPETYYKLAEQLGCKEIPLTWNFRCGAEIVKNANSFFPSDMKAAPGAVIGNVSECPMSAINNNNESAVLCEMNSPLLSYIITQLEKDSPVRFRAGKLWAKIMGIMWGLFDTRKYPVGTVAAEAERKIMQYSGEAGPEPDKMESLKCLQLIENIALIKGMTKTKFTGKKPVHPFQQVLEEISSGADGISCMTGHTAKGLQWQNVYHIPKVPAERPDKPRKPWENHQWQCVGYVIRTRAIENHFTVE